MRKLVTPAERRGWREVPLSMFFATVAGIGHIPGGPGTYAAAITVPLVIALSDGPWWLRWGIFVVVTLLSLVWCHRAGAAIDEHDSRRIVLDEVVGVWMALVFFADLAWLPAIVGFVLFRIFDVWKPPPIRRVESALPNGVGVVVDDLMAGLYAAPFVLVASIL